ncbi:MAG: protoporphyrinogen oxidase [Streptosporangiaceae bacterium]
MSTPAQPSVVVIGAGIAGLAAAWFLREHGVRVTVLESSPRVGGKLAVAEVGGVSVDTGAEALLARRPEGVGLAAEAGLADQLVSPGTTAAAIWTRGALRPLPRRQYMGVPADLDELAATGILSAAGAARARQDLDLPPTPRSGDVPVASYVGARFGAEVVDRLVDPLLGGVYAGRSDQLSFEATLPGLAAQSRQHQSLAAAAAALLPPPPDRTGPAQTGPAEPDLARNGRDRAGGGAVGQPAAGSPPKPVFTTLAGGLGSLPGVLAAASGAEVRTRAAVRELARTPGGWRLTVGSAHAPELLAADAVILALPARPAGRLLAGLPAAAAAAAALAEIGYASMAVITLAYPAEAFAGGPAAAAAGPGGAAAALPGSGFLVPAVDGKMIKAATFSTVKWPHLRPGPAAPHLVRCSVGRIGDEAVLQREDAELAGLAAAELAEATGVRARPADYRVTRWGGGLPQYTVGHLDRVARIRAGVAAQPGLAVCGAAYDGLGIPACIATARQAAGQILAHFETGTGTAAVQTGARGRASG